MSRRHSDADGSDAVRLDDPRGPRPSVEPVAPSQWWRVRAIRLRALRDAPDAFWTRLAQERSRTAASWRAQIGRDDRATFIATLAGTDVGIAVGAPHHVDATDAGVYALWVAPLARGRGAGEALLSAVIDWAAGRGYARPPSRERQPPRRGVV